MRGWEAGLGGTTWGWGGDICPEYNKTSRNYQVMKLRERERIWEKLTDERKHGEDGRQGLEP